MNLKYISPVRVLRVVKKTRPSFGAVVFKFQANVLLHDLPDAVNQGFNFFTPRRYSPYLPWWEEMLLLYCNTVNGIISHNIFRSRSTYTSYSVGETRARTAHCVFFDTVMTAARFRQFHTTHIHTRRA